MSERAQTDFEYALERFLESADRYRAARRSDSSYCGKEREERLWETAQELRYAAAAFARIAERAP